MNTSIGHIYRKELYITGVSKGFTFYAKYNGLVVSAQSVLLERTVKPCIVSTGNCSKID